MMTKRQNGMAQIPTMRSSLGEEDVTHSWLIGPTRSFLFWDSSVHQIQDGITMNRGNLESRARAQHDILIKSLERVAKDAEGENGV